MIEFLIICIYLGKSVHDIVDAPDPVLEEARAGAVESALQPIGGRAVGPVQSQVRVVGGVGEEQFAEGRGGAGGGG